MPHLPVALIGGRDRQRFHWPPFSFLSILASASSEESSTQIQVTVDVTFNYVFVLLGEGSHGADHLAHRVCLHSGFVHDRTTVITFDFLILLVPCGFRINTVSYQHKQTHTHTRRSMKCSGQTQLLAQTWRTKW